MLVLSDSDLASLLNAVPSFENSWAQSEQAAAERAQRFPDRAQTAEERARTFLYKLAFHVGRSVARKDLRELEWLGAAVESLLTKMTDREALEFTVAFLEDLVYGIEHAGGDASTVSPLMSGARTSWRWHQALSYTKGVYLYDRVPDQANRGLG